MNLLQFFMILQARWRAIAITFAIVVVGTLAITLLLPKEYTATTEVLVDLKGTDPLMGVVMPTLNAGYMATQVDIINSDRVAQRVVSSLGFAKVPQIVASWREATEGKGSLESFYGGILKRKLDVKPSRESSVISISFSGNDPKFSAQVANAFAQAYIDTNIDLKVEPAKQYAQWFDDRTKQLREKLETAQTRLSEYQKSKKIVSIDERLDVENTRLNELSSQLTALEALKTDSRSRQRQVATQMETMPDVINSPVVQGLRAELLRQESKLEELSHQYGKNHPVYQQQLTEANALRARLQGEMQKVASSLGTANSVNLQREQDIRAARDEQTRKILALKEQRDEMAVLVRDVDAAQRAYDLVTQRLSQSSLESQAQQANIMVLTPAIDPIKPSKPRTLLNIVLSIFVGLLLGVGVALVRELANRHIRSAEDVVALLNLPVLAVLPSESMKRKSAWQNAVLAFFRSLSPARLRARTV